MKIVHICSEANPFIKTGGLADVTYSLAKELANNGNEVAIVLPFYNQVKAKVLDAKKVTNIQVNLSWRVEWSDIYKKECDGTTYYLVENRHYFERDNVYGYDDDGERFAFFSLASVKLLEAINLSPDIIHIHDWQVGMVPVIIKENHIPFYKDTKFVLTIHNAAFRGFLDRDSLGDLYNLDTSIYDNGAVRLFDRVSTLKAGIMYADKIVAVSPTNRNELLTSEGGNGLDGALSLREYDFTGFLNGIDYDEFNPETDKYLTNHYSLNNFTTGKKKNKIELCHRFNLKNVNAPIFAMVSRMTWQKGTDLVFEAVHHIVSHGGNVVLLGSGEKQSEDTMNYLHSLYPDQVGVYVGYSNELAHLIYAGSDFFLMPSLFEPCGLGQMIAERYGTLPIVRRVGGLRDSVINYDGNNKETSNGFGFDKFTTYDMNGTCLYALDAFYDKELFKKLRHNAMKTDNSWKNSVKEYYGLYKSIVNIH